MAHWPSGSLPDLGRHVPRRGPNGPETDIPIDEPGAVFGPTNPDRVPHATVRTEQRSLPTNATVVVPCESTIALAYSGS